MDERYNGSLLPHRPIVSNGHGLCVRTQVYRRAIDGDGTTCRGHAFVERCNVIGIQRHGP